MQNLTVATEERVLNPDFPPAKLRHRKEFPDYLNHFSLTGRGALLGVKEGGFAEHILRNWRGRELKCIDTWASCSHDPSRLDAYSVPQWKLERAYQESHRRVGNFASRVQIHRMCPADAAALVDDKSLSFVYIDERVDFEGVWELLVKWFPKVVPGGIIAGSNYLNGRFPNAVIEVKSAVDTWLTKFPLEASRSGELVWASWIIHKPK